MYSSKSFSEYAIQCKSHRQDIKCYELINFWRGGTVKKLLKLKSCWQNKLLFPICDNQHPGAEFLRTPDLSPPPLLESLLFLLDFRWFTDPPLQEWCIEFYRRKRCPWIKQYMNLFLHKLDMEVWGTFHSLGRVIPSFSGSSKGVVLENFPWAQWQNHSGARAGSWRPVHSWPRKRRCKSILGIFY